MPTGPQGQKRPKGPIATAIAVAKIATKDGSGRYGSDGGKTGRKAKSDQADAKADQSDVSSRK